MSSTTKPRATSITGGDIAPSLNTQRVVTITLGSGPRFLDAWEIQQEDFNVVTRSVQSNNSQRWLLTNMGGGLYTIMQISSDRYLGAHEIGNLDFRVVTRQQQNNNTQLWRLIDFGGAFFKIQQVSSGRVLEAHLTDADYFQVVTRPESGTDLQVWRIVDANVFAVDRSAQFGTPPAAGPPTACVIPGLGVHNIAYRDTSGRLHKLWRDAQGATGTTNLTATAPAGTPTAAGDPFAYVDTSRNTEILLYRGGDGTVHSLYWSTGAVGHDNLSGSATGAPKAAGDPVGYYTSAADTHHVIYRTSNGHLHELNWIGIEPVSYGGNLTGAISAPTAVGQPSAFVNAASVNIVVYRRANGRILGLYWKDGPSDLDDLSGSAGTPPAAGDPVAYYTAHDDTHQVVYRTGNGHLYELYWPGVVPVVGWDITPPGAPAATGTPAAYYSAGTNTKHVIYRSADGRLHEIWWVPGGGTPAHVDLTAFAGAPLAADRPAAFTVEGPNSQHVAYRETNKHIYELRRW